MRSLTATAEAAAPEDSAPRHLWRRWILACTAAEAIGMTASATAAVASRTLFGGLDGILGWSLIIAGGLVEGLVLGFAQVFVLARVVPSLPRRRYVLLTVTVAGLGWAAGSAPGTLADGTSAGPSPAPALIMVLLGAAGIGLAMGLLLGAAQSWALRGSVRHPWRWIVANLAAWPVAMMIIFSGAGLPGDDWPWWSVVAVGLPTGAAAGAVLGLITGWWLPSLADGPLRHRLVLRLLTLPHPGGLSRRVVGLSLRGTRSGTWFSLPVNYARDDDGLVVVPGRAARKTWWRNVRTPGTPVRVLDGGDWRPGTAELLRRGESGYPRARRTNAARWPAMRWSTSQPIVRIRLP